MRRRAAKGRGRRLVRLGLALVAICFAIVLTACNMGATAPPPATDGSLTITITGLPPAMDATVMLADPMVGSDARRANTTVLPTSTRD